MDWDDNRARERERLSVIRSIAEKCLSLDNVRTMDVRGKYFFLEKIWYKTSNNIIDN